jgi:hypothetical protein
MKDKTVQKAKVLEVTLDKVKFLKFEVRTGPTYEILKSEVIKIRYANGYTDVFDKGSLSDTLDVNTKNRHDSVDYCMIYIVNAYNQGEKLKFPIYLNGKYVFTIKKYDRGIIKLFSGGLLVLERQPNKKSSPRLNLIIEAGKFYGISIDHHPERNIMNKRYSVRVVTDSVDFKKYMNFEFNGPNFDNKGCKIFQEDPSNPIIKL